MQRPSHVHGGAEAAFPLTFLSFAICFLRGAVSSCGCNASPDAAQGLEQQWQHTSRGGGKTTRNTSLRSPRLRVVALLLSNLLVSLGLGHSRLEAVDFLCHLCLLRREVGDHLRGRLVSCSRLRCRLPGCLGLLDQTHRLQGLRNRPWQQIGKETKDVQQERAAVSGRWAWLLALASSSLTFSSSSLKRPSLAFRCFVHSAMVSLAGLNVV